ncbi:MAG: hypothetical protein E7172_04435 [Firmicutes bacterium]|nr:hypothetical protein [Bacillota bacterium]
MVNLKILFIIIDEGFEKKINLLLNRFGIKVKIVLTASGTASSSILNYFGLTDRKKNVFMALIPEYLDEKILKRIKKVFSLEQMGKGIAFIIPLSSANKFLVDSFTKNKKEGSEKMDSEQYHLIITVISEGFLEQVMKVIKKCGGTVFKGRQLTNIIPKKIIGFNIGGEKDIILSIVKDNERHKIMSEISKIVGIKTKAKGFCISLPVEQAIGIKEYE